MHLSIIIKTFIKRKYLLDIVVIFIIGLLSLTWFKGNYLINGGDFGMPFDWVRYFKSMFSVWVETNSLGVADYRNIASIIPYALFGALMESFGFSLVFIEKIFFYFWFAGGGLSMYFLCSVLGMKRLGKIMAALFYMLNPFSLIIVWHVSHALIQMPYSFAPLYLGLYIYGLKEKKGLGYIFLFVLVWILTTVPAYAWPAALAIHVIPLFFYFLLSLIYFPAERSFTIKFTLKLVVIFLGLNFYWLFPFLYSITESMAGSQLPVLLNDIDTLKLTSNKVFDAIRMLGYWALHAGYKSDPYYSYESYYRSFLIKILSYLIPILVFLGFLNKDTQKKPFFLFFIVTIFFGIIGIAGPYSSFGVFLIALYKTFPSLALLTRFTFLFWGIPSYLIFTVLLGYGFLFIYEQGKRFLKKLIILPILGTAFILLVVLVKPFWTGEVINRKGQVAPGERVKIPDYWWEAKKWFAEQEGFYRIFPLPMTQTYNVAYDWEEGYLGGDPIRWISDNPVIFVNSGETFKIPELIGEIIEEERDFKETGKLLGMINVRYLLYRKDIVWDYIAGHSSWFAHTPEKIEKFLNNQKDLTLVKTFGPWDVYEISKENIYPRVYIPERIVEIDGAVEGIEDIIAFARPGEKKAIYFNKKFINENSFDDYINDIYIWQNPTGINLDLTSLQKLSIKDSADNLPFVSTPPDSPLYLLVRIKEYLYSLFLSSSNKLEFDKILAGKRLKEAFSLLENNNIPKAIKSLEEAGRKWEIIKSDWSDVGKRLSETERSVALEELKAQIIIDIISLASLGEKYQYDDKGLAGTIKTLEDKLKLISREVFEQNLLNFDQKISASEAVYNVEIVLGGEYEIFLKGNEILFPTTDRDKLFFQIDGSSFHKITPVFLENNLISLGKVSLEKGFHQIIINLTPPPNLVKNGSFENELWKDLGIFSPLPSFLPKYSTGLSADRIDGKYSLKLMADKGSAYISYPIEEINRKDFYKISFSAKHLWGRPPTLMVWQNSSLNTRPVFNVDTNIWGPSTFIPDLIKINFQPIPEWRNYEFVFKLNSAAKSWGIGFMIDGQADGGTANLFDKVSVEKVYFSPIILKRSIKEPQGELPKINFYNKGSARIDIETDPTKKPFLLVFSDGFHSGWKLSTKAAHLKVNGYANSWLVDNSDDRKQTFSLEFSLQKIYIISVSVSFFTLISLSSYFLFPIFSKIIERWKNKKNV